jgi:hypothetical protein
MLSAMARRSRRRDVDVRSNEHHEVEVGVMIEPAIHERAADEDGLEAVVASKSGHDAVQQSGVRSREEPGSLDGVRHPTDGGGGRGEASTATATMRKGGTRNVRFIGSPATSAPSARRASLARTADPSE